MTEQNNDAQPVKDDFIVMTNPMTREQVSIPASLQPYVQDVVRFNRKAGSEKLENENINLKAQIEDLTNQFNEFKDTSSKQKPKELDEDVAKKFQDMIDEQNQKIEQLVKDKENSINQYRNEKISNDLFSAMSAFEASSGSQIHDKNQLAATLKAMHNAQLVEDIDLSTSEKLGTFQTMLNVNIKDESGNARPVELSANDAVSKFLSMEENSFHLKNKLTPGGGSRNGNSNNNIDKFDAAYQEASKNNDLAGQIAAKQAEYDTIK